MTLKVKGWVLADCPACKIKLFVKKTNPDAKRCGVCGFVFPPKRKDA